MASRSSGQRLCRRRGRGNVRRLRSAKTGPPANSFRATAPSRSWSEIRGAGQPRRPFATSTLSRLTRALAQANRSRSRFGHCGEGGGPDVASPDADSERSGAIDDIAAGIALPPTPVRRRFCQAGNGLIRMSNCNPASVSLGSSRVRPGITRPALLGGVVRYA